MKFKVGDVCFAPERRDIRITKASDRGTYDFIFIDFAEVHRGWSEALLYEVCGYRVKNIEIFDGELYFEI